MSAQNKKPKSRTQSWWPLIGAFLIIADGILSYFLAGPTIAFLDAKLPNFPPAGVSGSTLLLIITVVLFVIIGSLVSLIVAAAAPKKRSAVTEKNMMKERSAMVEDKRVTKLRQKQINKMNKNG